MDDGRLQMAQSLKDQHPDITTIKQRWGRWQHVVNYRGFRYNKLIKKPGLIIPRGVNEYGLKLKTIIHWMYPVVAANKDRHFFLLRPMPKMQHTVQKEQHFYFFVCIFVR